MKMIDEKIDNYELCVKYYRDKTLPKGLGNDDVLDHEVSAYSAQGGNLLVVGM